MDVQQGRIYGYSTSFNFNCPVCGIEYELEIPLEHTEVLACPNGCGARFTLLVRDGDSPQLVYVGRPKVEKNAVRRKRSSVASEPRRMKSCTTITADPKQLPASF
jgi:transcription elongation factor Elf1